MSYDRQFVSQQLVLQANKIPNSLCFGRVGCDNEEKEFILSFFTRCSDSELREISAFVSKKKAQEEVQKRTQEEVQKEAQEELLLLFSMERDDGIARSLSKDEMASFDFKSHHDYSLSSYSSWDSLRDVPQEVLVITFA